MADTLLAVSNLETYYGPIVAIRGVSFDVPERAVVTILGANGAGKSTILKTVSGVMDPQQGAVTRKDAAGVAEDLELVYSYFPILRSRTEQRAGSLSGGEQQMLAISRALMARPRRSAEH